ncbi:unnamed protein product [Durusdinium trenchii]|uniref:Uncharacterized protein n=1 Tax=Durusdinium trenchii TaxID=1381693 RepID=A0ABP0RRA9_9DINO
MNLQMNPAMQGMAMMMGGMMMGIAMASNRLGMRSPTPDAPEKPQKVRDHQPFNPEELHRRLLQAQERELLAAEARADSGRGLETTSPSSASKPTKSSPSSPRTCPKQKRPEVSLMQQKDCKDDAPLSESQRAATSPNPRQTSPAQSGEAARAVRRLGVEHAPTPPKRRSRSPLRRRRQVETTTKERGFGLV